MFIEELLKKREYVFREKTVIWKKKGEYKLYYSIILETNGWNRFDYSAFHYGECPNRQDEDVIVYNLEMKPKQIQLGQHKYIIDSSIWNSQYRKYQTQFSNVF